MRCVNCGSDTLPPEAGGARPLDLGLEGLMIGEVAIHRCSNPECGEEYEEMPPLEQLLDVVVNVIAARWNPDTMPLRGELVRFLRKRLGWSQKDFAATFLVDPTTVSKWENDTVQMDAFKQKMLVLLAQRGAMLDDYAHDMGTDQQDPPFQIFVPDFTPPAPRASGKKSARR